MQTSLVTKPTTEPVSAQDMMTQLGFGTISDTGLQAELVDQLGGHAIAARGWCEDYTRRVLIAQEWITQLEGFPRRHGAYEHERHALVLPKPPFAAVTWLKYVDPTGALQTMPADTTYGADPNLPAFAYQVQAGTETQPARLLPAWSRFWPPTRCVMNAVQIQFTCGYGDAAADVPVQIIQAIKLLAQFYYENGGSTDMPVPQVVERLLLPYRNLGS